MLFHHLAALAGAAVTVSAFPALDSRSTNSNSSVVVTQDGGFEVVIVYAQPEAGCSQHRQCDSTNSLPPAVFTPSSSRMHVTTSAAETPAFSQAAPTAKLVPNVHWGFDTSPATNVIPIPADSGSPLYYGHSDPSQAGYFAFLTYYFNFPSVNLDHCDHVSSVICTEKGCKVSFASDEAYKYAVTHWSAYEELILVAFTEGCSQYADGERCYLKVNAIEFKGDLVVEVGGSFCHPDDIISKGETEWGWWTPRHGGTSVRTSASSGPTVTWSGSSGPTFSASKSSTKGSSGSLSTVRLVTGVTTSSSPAATSTSSSAAPTARTSAPNNGTTNGNDTDTSSFAAAKSDCVPPSDSKYGLPTACLGELFDKDLDDALGYAENLNSTYDEFIDYIAPGLEEYGDIPDPEADPDFGDMMDWSERRRRSLALSRRNNLNKRWPCLTCAIKAVGNFIAHPVDTLVALKDEIQQATSISGSVNKDLTFKVPDPANVEASRLQDPNAKQVTSPWGDSILLKSFGTQPESEGGDSKKRDEKEKALSGYMNVFCVGCGVSGHASVAGRASWTPLGGFIEGQVEMRADVQFVFKLGIDAQMTYSKEFNNNLLRLGLPGLTYGVVTIGPWVEVGSTVKLDAEAKGRLLAGAEMGLQNAHVLIDFINPSKSTKDGWEPYFKPVFEADGELMLSASLGLPFGLKCGLQVASFSKSVGLVDEPSIKGTAQVAASIGLASSGGFVAGFKDSNGCTGISTQISWRNKLYVDVLGLTQLSLLDTDDKPLAQGCIALPGLPSPSPSKSTDATTSAPTPTGIEESDSESSQTPTVEDDSQPSETESPNVEPTTTPSNDDESDPISGTDPDTSADDNSDAPTDQDGSGDGDDSGAVPEDVSSEDSSHDVVKRHSLVSRGTNSTNSTVRDITSKVKSNITTLSYETTSLPDHPYNDTAGYEYNLLTVPDGSIIFISCGNGAIYAVSPDGPDNPSCTPNWETYNDVIVADGADRIMHYYSNTMEAVGVSRLRVSNQQSVPEKGTIVAFVADDSDEDTSEDGGYFAALDPDMNVFYPVLCTYSDGNPARMFLAADPEKGPEILQSEDLEYSITGGKVDKCYTMPLLMGQWADDSEGYTSYNNSPSNDDDLDYDWDGYDWDQE